MTTTHEQIAIDALKAIARGQPRYGAPLPREAARQIARQALVRMHEHWGPLQIEKAADAHHRRSKGAVEALRGRR